MCSDKKKNARLATGSFDGISKLRVRDVKMTTFSFQGIEVTAPVAAGKTVPVSQIKGTPPTRPEKTK